MEVAPRRRERLLDPVSRISEILFGLIMVLTLTTTLSVATAGRDDLPAGPVLTREDWLAALGVFLLVFLSTFPVVIPFLVVGNVGLAIRLSNAVAITMLFAAGYWLARHGGYPPLRAGLSMVIVGVLLVAIAIALGG
jgi:VIT1/CCC1 family predicted Fe2+/Mn2+ transporter